MIRKVVDEVNPQHWAGAEHRFCKGINGVALDHTHRRFDSFKVRPWIGSDQNWFNRCWQLQPVALQEYLECACEPQGAGDQIYTGRLGPPAANRVPFSTLGFEESLDIRYIQDLHAPRSDEDHRDHDLTVWEGEIADEHITPLEQTVQLGDYQFLGFQIRIPAETVFECAAYPGEKIDLALGVLQRGLIVDFHWRKLSIGWLKIITTGSQISVRAIIKIPAPRYHPSWSLRVS